MTDEERNQEALFRHAILGDLLSRNLRRGKLSLALKQLAQQAYQDHHGRTRCAAFKTLEEWYYKYRKGGFVALRPRPRKDRHTSRVLSEELQQLILDMKREDPGRSARLIVRELELPAGFAHAKSAAPVSSVCCAGTACRFRAWSGITAHDTDGRRPPAENSGRPMRCTARS
jgi:putative transposase